MAVYQVAYDLNKAGQNYNDLYEAIKAIGDWFHPLESTWWVETNHKSSEDVFNILKPFIDDNDYMFISKITSDRYGWLTEQSWNWLSEKL